MGFIRGELVVCIDDSDWMFEHEGKAYYLDRSECPKKNMVYTADGYNSFGYLMLSEIQKKKFNLDASSGGWVHGNEVWGWHPERFRRVEKKSIERGMEILREICRTGTLGLDALDPVEKI